MAMMNDTPVLNGLVDELKDDPEFIATGLAVEIAEEAFDLMSKGNLKRSVLAQHMGVSRAHVSNILNAPTNMTLLSIARLAVALGVRPEVRLSGQQRDNIVADPIGPWAYVSADSGTLASESVEDRWNIFFVQRGTAVPQSGEEIEDADLDALAVTDA